MWCLAILFSAALIVRARKRLRIAPSRRSHKIYRTRKVKVAK